MKIGKTRAIKPTISGERSTHEFPSAPAQVKAKAGQVTFNRNELRILLNEYSRRVAAGEWRDYAMDFTRDRAVFSVFRHTAEHALYAIEKFPGKSGRPELFAVSRGPQRLKQSESLNTVLAAIKSRPRLRTVS